MDSEKDLNNQSDNKLQENTSKNRMDDMNSESSENNKNSKNGRNRCLIALVFLIMAITVNSVLNFAFIKPGLTRVILHELQTGNYQSVILGTSHGSYGLDADAVSETFGKKTMNLCIGGEYMQDSYYLLKLAMKKNKLETVVMDIDYQYLVNVPKDSISAIFIYNAYPFGLDKLSYFKEKVMQMEYRATLFPWMDYRDRYSYAVSTMKTKLSTAYKNYDASSIEMESTDAYQGSGFISRSRTDSAKADKLMQITWDESRVDQKSIAYLKKMVNLCKENNIQMVMTTVPVTPEKIQTSPETYAGIHQYLQSLADEYDCQYIDFNTTQLQEITLTSDDYWDYDGHMYGDSAKKFSKVYGKYLKEVTTTKNIGGN